MGTMLEKLRSTLIEDGITKEAVLVEFDGGRVALLT